MAISPGGRPADDSPVGTPGGRQNWVDKTGGLPKYVRMVAHALMRKGMSSDRAIPAAVNQIKKWAAGADNVRPQVQAAAAAALAEWEAKKGAAHSLSAPVAETVDLAPGDYSPPYDWKHGYIPITPAAALSKAGKGPHAGKGRTRTPKGKRITAGSVKKAAAKQAKAKALDDEQRGRGIPGAVSPAGTPPELRIGNTPRDKAESELLKGKTTDQLKRAAGQHRAASRHEQADMMDREVKRRRAAGQVPGNNNRGVDKSTQTGHSGGMTPTDAPEHAAHRAAPKSIIKRPADHAAHGAANPTGNNGDKPEVAKTWPVGQRVRAGVPGNDPSQDAIGRVVGHTDAGMLRVEYRNHRDETVVGTFNPSHARKTTSLGGVDARTAGGKSVRDMDRAQLEAGVKSRQPGMTTAQRREYREELNRRNLAESAGAPEHIKKMGPRELRAELTGKTDTPTLTDGTRVAYNGNPKDGTGTVVGRRSDSQGTILSVKDDKDGKTYEWAPDQVKPHDGPSREKVDNAKAALRAALDRRDTPPAAEPAAPKSTNPDATMRVEHGPDGTLIHGTSREDAAAIKEVGGFKWSRNLNAWYLPRTWREETRDQKVRQLEAKLGDKVGVDRATGPRKSAAERDAEKRERAAGRAERMDSRAEKWSAEADRRFEASDLREEKSGIPFGQPILVGHHSERRHRNAIEKAHNNLGKGVEAQRDAERAREAADRARRTAAGTESKTTIGNRIAKNEAEHRRIKKLATNGETMHGSGHPGVQKLRAKLADLEDTIQHDRGKLEAAGGVPSKDTVSAGDFVKIRGQWHPVRKANAKTVSVPHWTGGNGTSPWHEVSEHRKASDVSREDVARMIQETSNAFPSLKTELAKAAPPKKPDTPSPAVTGQSLNMPAPTSSPEVQRAAVKTPGLDQAAISRMSDDQLERAMQRLMASGTYDGPAFGLIEKELNRRDDEKRKGAAGKAPRR